MRPPGTNIALVGALIASALFPSCAAADAAAGLVAEPPDWTGTYAVDGQWDLSGPFSEDQTLGGAVAEMLVSRVVGTLGVPALVEEEAREGLYALIGEPIAAAVDSGLPAELGPNGALVEALRAFLGSVATTGTLDLEEGTLPGSMKGYETLLSFSYVHEGETHVLTPAELTDGGLSIEAEWAGTITSDTRMTVDTHPYQIHYGRLVLDVALRVLGATDLDVLAEGMAEALACSAVVTEVLGDEPSIPLGVGDVTYDVEAADLESACGELHDSLGDRVLGLFTFDTPASAGGDVRIIDADGDRVAESLQAEPGYGGTVDLVSEPFAPHLGVQFTAVR